MLREKVPPIEQRHPRRGAACRKPLPRKIVGNLGSFSLSFTQKNPVSETLKSDKFQDVVYQLITRMAGHLFKVPPQVLKLGLSHQSEWSDIVNWKPII